MFYDLEMILMGKAQNFTSLECTPHCQVKVTNTPSIQPAGHPKRTITQTFLYASQKRKKENNIKILSHDED